MENYNLVMVSPFFFREGNDPDDYSRLTYRKLLEEVCRFANVLKSLGVSKGDRVGIYMPMILETVIAMLACARIGAVHSIVVSITQFVMLIYKYVPLYKGISTSSITALTHKMNGKW